MDPQAPRAADVLIAFASGGLLTLMILCNGTVAGQTTPLFSSLAAHGVGAVAAVVFVLLRTDPKGEGTAPAWAWLGGLCGAVTVVMSSITMNSPLALSGTLALGLAGQAAFGLVQDRFGWFGLTARPLTRRDALVMALVGGGSLLVILGRAG